MYGLAVNLTISLSGHLSNIDEMSLNKDRCFFINYFSPS
jgi:hypothetical protein